MKIVLFNGKKNYRSANLLEIKFIISNEFLIFFKYLIKLSYYFWKIIIYYLEIYNDCGLWIVDNYM